MYTVRAVCVHKTDRYTYLTSYLDSHLYSSHLCQCLGVARGIVNRLSIPEMDSTQMDLIYLFILCTSPKIIQCTCHTCVFTALQLILKHLNCLFTQSSICACYACITCSECVVEYIHVAMSMPIYECPDIQFPTYISTSCMQ